MFTEDLGVFFDADELGDLCVVGGQDVVGIFTTEGTLTSGVEGESPVLVVAASDVPAVTHGTSVVAPKGGTSYTVRQILPDGTGRVYRLILEEA